MKHNVESVLRWVVGVGCLVFGWIEIFQNKPDFSIINFGIATLLFWTEEK